MGIGLIVVSKSYSGEDWANTYGIAVGEDYTTPLTSADLDAIGANNPLTAANTDPADASYSGGTSILAAILGFERQLHFAPVVYTSMFISDGQKNNGLPIFKSIPLSMGGLIGLNGQDESVIAPGNVTWQIDRVPASVSVRSGRLFLRAALDDGSVRWAGRGAINWADASVKASYDALLAAAITTSLLENFLANGANAASAVLGIPQYVPAGEVGAGDLARVNAISTFSSDRPVSRQVKRGRRTPTPQPTP